MNISEVAIKAGLSVKTVRYYADIALVPEAERSAAGYRTYDEPALKKLIFAKRAREFGFSISECQELLSLYQDEERTSANVKVIAQRRLEEIIQKHPLDGEALLLSARLATEELDYARAALRFERAAKLPEFEVTALISHARMLVGAKDYQQASDLLERAQILSPQPRVARYLKAINNLNLSARKSL